MKTTKNPNDISAKYYDYYTAPLKGEVVTAAEIELIKTITPAKSTILDVGCGTGRHLIKLSRLGFHVTGIDSSTGMLNELRKKNPKIQIFTGEILKLKFPGYKYNLITLFWNTFNEIALTQNNAKKLLFRLQKLLNREGKILINIDNPRLLNLPKLQFKTVYKKGKLVYLQEWRVLNYIKKSRTTHSQEHITISLHNNVLAETVAEIKQKWWGKKELISLCRQLHFHYEFVSLPVNEEYYLVLSKI